MLLLALPATAPRAPGQEPALPDSTRADRVITGFGSIPWGGSREAVVKQWGEPASVDTLSHLSAVALVYRNQEVLGEPAAMGFLLHRKENLIRGQYLVSYGGGRDCERVYVKYRDAVGEALEGARRREKKDSDDPEVAFCTALEMNQATAVTRWRDTLTGAEAVVRLDPRAGTLRISYQSPRFEEIAEAARKAEGARRFEGADPGREAARDTSGRQSSSSPYSRILYSRAR